MRLPDWSWRGKTGATAGGASVGPTNGGAAAIATPAASAARANTATTTPARIGSRVSQARRESAGMNFGLRTILLVVAVILFVIAVFSDTSYSDLLAWGLAAFAASFLVGDMTVGSLNRR